jgi:hypothetical protein
MSEIILRRRWSHLMAAGFAALVSAVAGVAPPTADQYEVVIVDG